MSKYKETPEVSAGITELLLRYGNEVWFFNAYQIQDDAGARLQVEVVDQLWFDDVLPRCFYTPEGRCFVVVKRVQGDVKEEKSGRTERVAQA